MLQNSIQPRNMKFDDFFDLSIVATTRGHPFKLFKEYSSVNARKSFLVNVLLMCGTICHQILLTSVRYAHLKGQSSRPLSIF